MDEFKRITLINASVLAIIAIALAIYVFQYDLENNYGYAYFFYLLYTSIMLFFVNALTGVVNLLKRDWEAAKPFFLTAGLSFVSGIVIGFAGSKLIELLI